MRLRLFEPPVEKTKVQGSATTIVIADDHPLFRGALRQAIASVMPQARIVEASGIEDLNATLTRERDADLILLDLTMPGVQGFSGLMSLRAQYPELPVVIVSATEEATVIRRAMEFGASGFIPKSIDADSIGGAIQAVLAGDTWTPPDVDLSASEDPETADLVRRLGTLTPQQVRVLTMLSEGLLNKQIAYELGVSEATVKAHVSAILDKLGVDSRTQAVIAASKIGVTQRPSQAGAD
jgi:DNA-binding NarL/FixJ family response regulator